MSKIRDALFESHKADPELLGTILNSCDYFSLPLSMVIHGDYGSGKTRLLKIIEASAIVRKIPCTFFHASQYEPSQINLARVLLTKMGAYYLKTVNKKEMRAKIFGALAGSFDGLMKFIGNDFSILETREAILKGIKNEKVDIFGEWVKFGDPVEGIKSDFAKMVCDVSKKKSKDIDFKENDGKVPWIILIDDMDRLMPEVALDLILSLRVLLNGIDSESGPVPVLFLFALNTNCLRDAIRSRYANITDDKGKQNEFVEQFIRKYFIFGPQIPMFQINDLIEIYRNQCIEKKITPTFFQLISQTGLSCRTILNVLDKVEYLFECDHELVNSDNLFLIIFLLELLRYNSEEEFSQSIAIELNRKGKSFSLDIFSGIKDGVMKGIINNILKNSKIMEDSDSWQKGIQIIQRFNQKKVKA